MIACFIYLLQCLCTSYWEPEVDVRCLSLLLPILIFEVVVSLNLVLADSDRLAGQQIPGIILVLLPQCRCALPCRPFYVSPGDQTQIFMVVGQVLYQLGCLPSLSSFSFSPIVYISTNSCHQQCTIMYILTKMLLLL